MLFRTVRGEDVPALLKIYAQYIDTPVTFEYALPSAAEFSERVAAVVAFYPWLVCEEGGECVGYAYAHRMQERAAYAWNAELSIYLGKEYCGRGIGKKLYSALIRLCAAQGIKTVYGIVTVPNARSERLHESLGFRRAGVLHNSGFKGGAWHSVAYFEKNIAPYGRSPSAVRPFPEIAAQAADILSFANGDK